MLPGILRELGFCLANTAVAPTAAPGALDAPTRDGLALLLRVVPPREAPRDWPPGTAKLPLVLVDFVQEPPGHRSTVASIADAANAAADGMAPVGAHMHYFCTHSPPRLATAGSELVARHPGACIVPDEYLRGLLRIARTHATPHQAAGGVYMAARERSHGFVSCCPEDTSNAQPKVSRGPDGNIYMS